MEYVHIGMGTRFRDVESIRMSEAFDQLYKLSKKGSVHPSHEYQSVAVYIGQLFMTRIHADRCDFAIARVEELTNYEWTRIHESMLMFNITLHLNGKEWKDIRVGLIRDLETIRAFR